jgi:peptidoglycan hydrolase FlgJ
MLNSGLQSGSNYVDMQELTALRREAGKHPSQALEKVAQQFEALFMQMMLKSMRDAGGEENGLFDNDQTRLYQDMYDKQLSLSLSETGNGMGLAKLLVQQLQKTLPQQGDEAEQQSDGVVLDESVPARSRYTFTQAVPGVNAHGAAIQTEPRFDSPESFINALLPHAQKAGEELGIDPRAILAQAALETGWGKSVIRHADGRSSYNLFNIKAGSRWQGEQVGRQTLEYRNGVTVREQASFRSYGSLEECFADYTSFLQNSGRYRYALEHGGDGNQFAEQLQKAGYATDPAYAGKIKRILNSDLLVQAGEGLNLPAEGTLTS